jgi:hypothetical protein
LVLVLALLALAGACSDSTAAAPTELLGSWVSAPEDLSPQGSHQRHLTFAVAGEFVSEVRTFGLYAGQPRDLLSAYTRTEGSYRVAHDSLTFEPRRLVWWDRFYGADSPVHVVEPYPWGGLFDDARYEVNGDRLTLRFTVYPADGPVPAVGEYRRQP